MSNRMTEKQCRQLLEKILPDRSVRSRCLEVLAEGVVEANKHGRDKWAVRVDSDYGGIVRFLVGHHRICTIQQGRLWMALDEDMLEVPPIDFESKQLMDCWSWEDGDYSRYDEISSRNGYYLPGPSHRRVWRSLRFIHHISIFRAAYKRPLLAASKDAHSPAFLRYLRAETGINVPDPLYDI